MRLERFLIMEKKKEKTTYDKIRKPTAPPSEAHKDKNKYDRKEKHKKKYDE